MKKAWKLFRLRKDESLGSLFINVKERIPVGTWLDAEFHPTKGYAPRRGWHCTLKPRAPHLSKKGRTWRKVMVLDYEEFDRPKNQGGRWLLSQKMIILERNPRQREIIHA